jgi:recombination associated protein RdgC
VFKNLSIYSINPEWTADLSTLESALAGDRFQPCSPSQEQSVGWVEPRGIDHGPMVESVAGQWLACLMVENKQVPSGLIKRQVQERTAALEATTGRKPGKKLRKEWQEDIRRDLLPQAFAQQTRVWVWFNPKDSLLMLDATSAKRCDVIITALVKHLPNFAPRPLQTQQSAASCMAAWLLTPDVHDWPEHLYPDRECELRSQDDERSVVRYTRHAVCIDEVREHIKAGKQVLRLGLQWNGQVQFVLTEALQLKKIRFMDSGDDTEQAAKDAFDANLALASGQLSGLIADLIKSLGGRT